MLRKEEFPKEPIEILKDVLPSEEFKKLASLNQDVSISAVSQQC